MILPGDIKRVADVVEIAKGYTELRRERGSWRGPCPVHGGDNKTAFAVFPDSGNWYCYTHCGGGDVIDLVMRCQGLNFSQACYLLGKQLGLQSGRRENLHVMQRQLGLAGKELRAFGVWLGLKREALMQAATKAERDKRECWGFLECLGDFCDLKGPEAQRLAQGFSDAQAKEAEVEAKLMDLELHPDRYKAAFLRSFYGDDEVRGVCA